MLAWRVAAACCQPFFGLLALLAPLLPAAGWSEEPSSLLLSSKWASMRCSTDLGVLPCDPPALMTDRRFCSLVGMSGAGA
jgi:hypothetical protein